MLLPLKHTALVFIFILYFLKDVWLGFLLSLSLHWWTQAARTVSVCVSQAWWWTGAQLFADIDSYHWWMTHDRGDVEHLLESARGSRSKDCGTWGVCVWGVQCGFFSSCRHYLIPWTLPLHPPQAGYTHRSITRICHPLIAKLWKNCASKAITSAVSQGL